MLRQFVRNNPVNRIDPRGTVSIGTNNYSSANNNYFSGGGSSSQNLASTNNNFDAGATADLTRSVGGDTSFLTKLGASLPSLPQGVVDFSAGLGDSLLLGFGGNLRNLAGVGGVNTGSSEYTAGVVASFAAGGTRLAYAGLAKAGSVLASSAQAASSFRNGLKTVFRGGIFPNFRKQTYQSLKAAGRSDAAIRTAAGKTNKFVNTAGAQAGVGGAIVFGQQE